MTRQPVSSSSLASVGYDPDTKTLHVEFTSGRVYSHADVPAHIHEQLVTADSIGRAYNRLVRGQFAHSEITPPAAAQEA